ncbi:MAG TPA: hypothetical protein PJ982_15870, partial [Lacipirellulaceae bacterium]|nr:hypothetical protein [Lacipirellulaceae bacterium]
PCSNLAELEALVAQSRRGDAAASATVRQVFADAQNPIWQEAGNLVELAERMLAASIFPQAPAAALSVSRYGQHLRDELSDQGASPLERLAIARVVMAWNLAGALDLRAAAASAGAPSAPLVKAQDAAERRFHKALASLQLAREISRSSAGRPFRSLSSHDGPQQGPPAKENPRKPRAMA